MRKDDHLIFEALQNKQAAREEQNPPHGYPQGITAIQNLLINELKKRGFEFAKVSHANTEQDGYPTVFMKRVQGPMHTVAEISGMGMISGEPYKKYLSSLNNSKDVEETKYRSGARPDPEDPYYDTWQSIAQDHAGEDAEMPTKDFNKLKQHINKGPIQIKKPSKELPYTHKYIHHLAKQDSREGQKEEDAESACIEDLATKHGVSLEDITNQLEMGLKVEMEHTEDMDVAKKIALDHLAEDPHYYTKLAKMEGKGENEERRLDPKCWSGYHKAGTKLKSGVRVNNCVKN